MRDELRKSLRKFQLKAAGMRGVWSEIQLVNKNVRRERCLDDIV